MCASPLLQKLFVSQMYATANNRKPDYQGLNQIRIYRSYAINSLGVSNLAIAQKPNTGIKISGSFPLSAPQTFDFRPLSSCSVALWFQTTCSTFSHYICIQAGRRERNRKEQNLDPESKCFSKHPLEASAQNSMAGMVSHDHSQLQGSLRGVHFQLHLLPSPKKNHHSTKMEDVHWIGDQQGHCDSQTYCTMHNHEHQPRQLVSLLFSAGCNGLSSDGCVKNTGILYLCTSGIMLISLCVGQYLNF